MSENLQTSYVTWVWKLDADVNLWEAQLARMLLQPCLDYMLKSKEWKVETHTDGFGRPYVTLEITLPPLSSTDEIEKSGSLYYARKTLSGLSDLLSKDPLIPNTYTCFACDSYGNCTGACYGK